MKTKVAQASMLTEGTNQCVKPSGHKILLVKHQGKVHAIENRCPHLGMSLEKGKVVDGVITCPFHGSSFDICTGANQDWVNSVLGVGVPKWTAKMIAMGKQPQPVRVYEVEMVGDDVMVELG